MSEKFLTLHPEPDKQGVRIDRVKYELVAKAIQDLIARVPGAKPQRLQLTDLQLIRPYGFLEHVGSLFYQ